MKRSKTERALIGVDQRGCLVVLATDGPWIASDCENVCTGAEDIGLADKSDCPTPGLYLFEGYGEQFNDGSWDGPVEISVRYEGKVRPVKPEEIAELYAMEAPETCPICGKEATTEYEGVPSCGSAKCELAMQVGADYHAEAGER